MIVPRKPEKKSRGIHCDPNYGDLELAQQEDYIIQQRNQIIYEMDAYYTQLLKPEWFRHNPDFRLLYEAGNAQAWSFDRGVCSHPYE